MVKMKKTYKKKAIFSFLLVAVLMMCGCGNVNSDEAEASDSSEASETEEVSESEEAEEDTEAVCWIMETEKEKALTARGETYELAASETETVLASAGTVDMATGESEEAALNASGNNGTNSTGSSGSSIGSTSSSSGGTNTASSSGSSGNSSSSSNSGSSSNTSSTSGSGSTTTASCTHNWQLTSTKAEEGYYTYHAISGDYDTGHKSTRNVFICNQCGYTTYNESDLDTHFKNSRDENGWLTCGSYTVKSGSYYVDNIAWLSGTATGTWITTSEGVYTYTCSKCGETKTENFTENHSEKTITFTIDPYNGEDVDSWLNSHYN